MQHPDLSRSRHEQRLREARRHSVWAHQARDTRSRTSRRSLRRVVGRTVVRIGLAIEAEPRQPIASS